MSDVKGYYYGRIGDFCDAVHLANEKWWEDPATGLPIERNVGEMIALVHSELSEALEGHRKSLRDDHLPQYESYDVELIDVLIRVFDMLGYRQKEFRVPVDDIYRDKMEYNANRADHKHEARLGANGKKY